MFQSFILGVGFRALWLGPYLTTIQTYKAHIHTHIYTHTLTIMVVSLLVCFKRVLL